MGEGTEVLQERVKQLEAELSSRDEKLEKFRKRLGGRLSQLEISAGDGSIETEVAVTDRQEKLQDQERETLEKENSELKERVVNLENDLSVLLKMMDDQQKEEFAQSSSTEISFFSTDAPSSTYSDTKHGIGRSSSPFSSPKNSPHLQRKNQTSDDIATLQSCLQLALEEKKTAEQQTKKLQTELDSVRAELEEAKRSWGQEKERLLRQLLKAHVEIQRVQMQDHQIQHPLPDVPLAVASTPKMERHQHSQQHDEISSPTRTRGRTSSSGSLTSSSELEKSSESTKSDMPKPATGERKERARGGKGILRKQRSRENFTAALAIFQSGEAATSPTKERRRSDSSPGSACSSMSPAPTSIVSSPQKLSTESRAQSVTVTGKPPIPPSSSSGHHSRQSSVDETGQRSPSKMSIGAKRSSWTVAQRRKSFEEESPSVPTPRHSRTASSPIMTRTLGSPMMTPKETETKEKVEKKFDEVRARREQERRKQELEAEEKRKRELEAKRRREAEEKEKQRKEKEKQRKEKEEKERIRREKEEKERQRKRELEEKSRREKEEREKKRQEELERKRKEEERERVRKEREEREKERKRELEERTRREKEEREKKRREELEKKRQLEQRKKEEEEEREQKKLEMERKRKEEQEAALRRQREEEEQKRRQTEAAALKQQKEEEEKKKRQEEIERKLKLEEEKRNAEKAAQAAIDPLPSKVNQHQSPFGSIAMRRAAFEQSSSTPPVVLRRNNFPAQRPKSMDIGALMFTPPPSSPVASPTPHSPQISSISVKTSKSPQTSPVPPRKEMKEVTVGRVNSIPKPSPPVTTVIPRSATVSITTTSFSPPLRRAQTLSLTPASLAVSSPDLTSLSSSNGSYSPTHSPSPQHKTVSSGPKSPQTDRKLPKTVSFSPNLSAAGRPPGILKPSALSPVNTTNQSSSSVNKMRFGPAQARLGVPADDMKKAQSLQNIPEHAMAEDTPPQTTSRFTPTAPHVNTRRPRSERAKTTSLSHANATNLVNLISKMQDKDKAPPLTNGVSNSQSQKTPSMGRPVSMYGSITPSRYVMVLCTDQQCTYYVGMPVVKY